MDEDIIHLEYTLAPVQPEVHYQKPKEGLGESQVHL